MKKLLTAGLIALMSYASANAGISGKVTNLVGKPMENVQVCSGTNCASTNSNGEFGLNIGIEDALVENQNLIKLNSSNIEYALTNPSRVSIQVNDILGRSVLNESSIECAGNHTIGWKNGKHLASGIYILRFQTEKDKIVKKIVLLENELATSNISFKSAAQNTASSRLNKTSAFNDIISFNGQNIYSKDTSFGNATANLLIKVNQKPLLKKIESPYIAYLKNSAGDFNIYLKNFENDGLTRIIYQCSWDTTLEDILQKNEFFTCSGFEDKIFYGFDEDAFINQIKKELPASELNQLLSTRRNDSVSEFRNVYGINRVKEVASKIGVTEKQQPIQVMLFNDTIKMEYLNPFRRPDGSSDGWTYLSRDQKNKMIDSLLEISKVDTHTYLPGVYVCHHFATDLKNEFVDRFNLPMYYLSIPEWNHAMNFILIGDNPDNINDWRRIEPQSHTNGPYPCLDTNQILSMDQQFRYNDTATFCINPKIASYPLSPLEFSYTWRTEKRYMGVEIGNNGSVSVGLWYDVTSMQKNILPVSKEFLVKQYCIQNADTVIN